MAGGLFHGLSKLLDAGASYLQHQQFVERLRGMQLEDAKIQLATYVSGMSDVGYNGLKLALTLLARNSNEPGTSKLLNGLLDSLDAAREGSASKSTDETTLAARLVDTPPARSFDDDLTRVAGWYELDQDGRVAALSAHLAELKPHAFNIFRSNVSQMVNNVAAAIRELEANEDNAMGGFVEDRMDYLLARLKTGQRDPAFLARLRELQDYGTFYEWVGTATDLVAEEREQQLRAQTRAQPASTAQSVPVAAATGSDDGLLATIAMLRTQLQGGLASGEIRSERRASYERLLDKLENLMPPLSAAGTSVTEKSKLIERFRGLMAEFQQAYVTPGSPDRLDRLREGARARTIETAIAEMKGFLYRELAQSPPQHTAGRAAELLGDLTRAHQEVAGLDEDEAAIAFEHEMLRVTALGLHDYAQREHLMLVRPLWECGEVMVSANGLFYSGRADLGETVRDLAARLRLDLPSEHGQYYGQARWDALRRCHVGVFDLRGYRPGLVQSDAAAGVALAASAYELGLASALGKPVVIVTRPDDALPFDIDIVPCEISGDTPTDKQALTGALDHAWYGRQRTIGSSSLAETFAFLDQITQDHPRRRMLEATGLLDARQIDDPIGFIGSVKQILREQGLADIQVIFPAWPGHYPNAAMPSVFHVMPFSESWSNAVRDTVRASCNTHGFVYKRGDEADEGRIIQSIWQDICAAHSVLVDLTGLNVNVLIELGMAHALGRIVLTVRQAGLKEPLPRNIEKLRVLDYDSPAGLSRLLESRLAARVPTS
jgi:hypothetical protein